MKNIGFILIIILFFFACRKGKVKSTQIHQETPAEQNIIDTTDGGNFGEHKSIHQQEWEKHKNKADADSTIF